MFVRSRTGRAAVVAAVALATLATPTLTAASQAASPDKPGLVGPRVVLQDHASFSGYDAGTDAAGNTYIGWIGDNDANDNANREVYLCTLPPGAEACSGGIQAIPSLDISGSADLRLLVTPGGLVTLVWFHDHFPAAYDGRDGRIAIATSQSGGPLTPATDVATAPSNGELLDAELGPGGALWTIAAVGAGTSSMEVREGVANAPVNVALPYSPGVAELAFSGTQPVIAVTKDAAITSPVGYISGSGAGFTGVGSAPATWTGGANIGLVGTPSGVRLIASENDAGYWPVIAQWTGSAFAKPHLTGDKRDCAPSTHDLNTDASGRLVDISNECGNMTVANLPGTTVASTLQFPAGGIPADGIPQIATTPRGHGVVVWSVEDASGPDGNRLYFSRLLLPGLDTSVAKRSSAGRVTVTGPVSCLPASTIAVAVKGAPVAGWRVSSASLSFGGKKLAAKTTLDGAKLTGGKLYLLSGHVVFSHGGHQSTVTESLKFRSCNNP
jgi:hypothetical protein